MKSKRPQKKTRREKKRFKKKTILLIISALFIITSFFYVMNNEYLAVADIRIDGQRTIIQSDITTAIDEYLSGKTLGLIRRDNILVLNTKKITKILQEKFPKIQELSVMIDNADTLHVTIGERSVHSLWCINRAYDSVFDEECYFSDSNGLLYARAPYFSGNVYMKLFIEPTEDDVYIGTTINHIDSFTDFFTFISQLEETYSISIGNIIFRDFDDVAIELSRINNQLYNIKRPVILYNKSHDYDVVLRDVGIIMDFDSFKNDFKLRAGKLESIDVRFENRALYTFTPSETEE